LFPASINLLGIIYKKMLSNMSELYEGTYSWSRILTFRSFVLVVALAKS